MTADLQTLANRSSRWLAACALPYWGGPGFDETTGSFVERLAFDGRPLLEHDKRLRVQARQIYAFTAATERGWADGRRAVERTFAFVTRHGWRADGGWVHSVSRTGEIRDPRLDLYDHAFMLFALASIARLFGADAARPWIARTLDVLDRRFADSAHGGFLESRPPTLPRRSNPHMHLLEAFLALHEAGAEASALARADAIVRLFEARFYDRDGGFLREFFDAAWSPAPGARGDRIEPGHLFEWAWLLDRHARSRGAAFPGAAKRLADFAERSGRLPGGLIADLVTPDGALRDAAVRIWPQTEALKAQLALRRAGDADASVRLARTHDALFRTFLDRDPPGTWTDHFGADGRPCVDFVPASSLYHLVFAFAELADAARP